MEDNTAAVVAERTWHAISPDGTGSELVLSIGVPVHTENRGWACVVSIGFIDPAMTIYGVDSWQAIHLAMRLVAARVGHYEDEGWKFYWDRDGDRAYADDLALPTSMESPESQRRYEESTEEEPFTPEQEEIFKNIAVQRAGGDFARLEAAQSDEQAFSHLPRAAAASFHLGRFDHARTFAARALALAPSFKDEWDYGNAIHIAHTVLGLLALQRGDVPAACEELFLSGATPGSPQLNSFGPTMQLAKALLVHGQSAPVLAYLEQCRTFWKTGTTWLDLWEAKIASGRVPNFFQHSHV